MDTPSAGQKRKADDVGNISGEEAPKRQKVEEEMDSDSKGEKKARKVRKRNDMKPSETAFILEIQGMERKTIEEIMESIKEAQEDYPGAKAAIIPNENIRLIPTEKQKNEERKKYRREYNKKPENIEKRRLKAQSPEEMERRKNNNADPLIQERKKQCAIGRRKTLREFRERYPDAYEEIHAKYVPELPVNEKRKKRISKKKESDSTSSSTTTNSSTTGSE